MQQKPKISIIVPVYNCEKYLEQCIESIINQALKDIEIICVNDGSKDNSLKILENFQTKDERIKIINKKNSGCGASMNMGLEAAKGEYIGIVEADDFIDLKMYENLYEIAKKYESDIVKSCFYDNLEAPQEQRITKMNWDSSIAENESFTIKQYPQFLYYHPSIWSCIYKKEFLDKNNIRYTEVKGAGWVDNLFQVQTMCLAEKINYTAHAYYYWRRKTCKEADSLSDYTIPFKRSDEIHKWLNENNINDKTLLTQLFRRELAYIKIVLSMKKISNIKDCYRRINSLMSHCPKGFLWDKTVKNHEKRTFLLIKLCPELMRIMLSNYLLF